LAKAHFLKGFDKQRKRPLPISASYALPLMRDVHDGRAPYGTKYTRASPQYEGTAAKL
jgi:hypothetical protein